MMESRDKIVRGTVVRLYPIQTQARTFDLWRNRTRGLWNLLLSLEQAAYSGEDVHPEIGWRQIWADVSDLNHRLLLDARDRKLANVEDSLAAWREEEDAWQSTFLDAESGRHGMSAEDAKRAMRELKRVSREITKLEKVRDKLLNPDAPPRDKILARGLSDPPKLFIWENDLQKVMARLKQVPRTAWIADLPSHAAQHVVKDLIKALQAMLRERGKRAAGTGGRDTGFPKFKAARYASGSVYFANTQISFPTLERDGRVKFPNGVGTIRYSGLNVPDDDADLMGGRIWRQGEDWYLSTQWRMSAPKALPETGKSVGVKIAASVILTTVDSDGRSRQVDTPKEDKRRARRYRLAGRKLSRRMEAQKKREAKAAARKGVAKVRLRRSNGFYEASARLAKMEAHERNKRDDLIHKETRKIVDLYDRITVQEMDVASMTKKDDAPSKRERRREQMRELGKAPKPGRVMWAVRRLNKRAAMARVRQVLSYKAEDGGRILNVTHGLMPIVQECSCCGAQHPEMANGKPVMKCNVCGTALDRRKNAAVNELNAGHAMAKASEVLRA